VDRRAPALVALMLFVVLTGVSIAVGAARPATDPGALPWLLQGAGYLCAVAAGGLLLRGQGADGRRIGGVVLGAVAVLVLLDALTAGRVGADIGAGLGRLVFLLVIGMATARLAVTVAAARRSAS
jgi:hypothetical protein